MSETTIARLACTYALPRDRDPTELRARLDRVRADRLAGAVAAALAPLDDVDPGAVWVVRALRSEAVVSTTDDLDELAAQWGGQLAGGIMDVLRRGPGGNVVRFGSRAEYLASFAAALAERRAHTWVFEPLAGLRLLAPATAIRAGAESARIRAADVIAELVALNEVETVLGASSATEAAALWAACVDETAGRRASVDLVERVAAAASVHAPASAVEPAAMRALRMFAQVAAAVGRGPEVVAAVDALVGGSAPRVRSKRRSRANADRTAEPVPRGGNVAKSRFDDEPESAFEPTLDADVFAVLGAPAFMLLPSLEAVGLADEHPGVRARVLGCLLDSPIDTALLLAAGAEDDDLDVELDGAALVATVVAALEADDRPDAAQRFAAGEGDALERTARAAVEHFARRLLGFDRASTPYLVERFLPPGGVVSVTAETIHAELQPAPLAVVLVMAGLDAFAYRVPWLEQDVVVTHRAG